MLANSQMRIRRHQKDAHEYVFHAMVYCLQMRDFEAAGLLARWLVLLNEEAYRYGR